MKPRGEPVYPTPVIGMIGLLDDVDKRINTPGFKAAGHKIAVLAKDLRRWAITKRHPSILTGPHGIVAGDIRYPDLEMEKGIIEVLAEGAKKGLFASAQDVSLGWFCSGSCPVVYMG